VVVAAAAAAVVPPFAFLGTANGLLQAFTGGFLVPPLGLPDLINEHKSGKVVSCMSVTFAFRYGVWD
jgi:hypothetical protein